MHICLCLYMHAPNPVQGWHMSGAAHAYRRQYSASPAVGRPRPISTRCVYVCRDCACVSITYKVHVRVYGDINFVPKRCMVSHPHPHCRHGVVCDESYDECDGNRDRRYMSSRSYQGGTSGYHYYTREGSGEAARDTEAYAFTAGYGPPEAEEEYWGAHGHAHRPKFRPEHPSPRRGPGPHHHQQQQYIPAPRVAQHHPPRLQSTSCETLGPRRPNPHRPSHSLPSPPSPSPSASDSGAHRGRSVKHTTLHESKMRSTVDPATLRTSPTVQNQPPHAPAQRALLPTPRKYRSRSASPPRGSRRGVVAVLGR